MNKNGVYLKSYALSYDKTDDEFGALDCNSSATRIGFAMVLSVSKLRLLSFAIRVGNGCSKAVVKGM